MYFGIVFGLLLTFVLPTAAQEKFDEGIFTYNCVSGDSLSVVSFSQDFINLKDTLLSEIHIPSVVTHNGRQYVVKSIAGHLWDNNTGVRKVIIDEGIKIIKDEAFWKFRTLEEIHIPSTVDSIGNCILAFCDSLRKIEIDEKNLAYSSFSGRNCIADVRRCELIAGCSATEIPDNVTHIKNAFWGCCKLREINIPEGTQEICDWAFVNCPCLSTLYIPSTVKFMSGRAFIGCPSLESFHVSVNNTDFASPDGSYAIIEDDALILGCHRTRIPANIKIIRECAFRDRLKLDSIEIPEGIEVISDEAFYGCKNLKHISLPRSIMRLDGSVFGDCISLRTVNIPKGVEELSGAIFQGCYSLYKVRIER